jgi:hypothetical protein
MAALDDGTCTHEAASGWASSPFFFFGLVILALPTILWLVLYWIPELYMMLRPVPNLKKKYLAVRVAMKKRNNINNDHSLSAVVLFCNKGMGVGNRSGKWHWKVTSL